MMSQDNRLLPMSSTEIVRPLRELRQTAQNLVPFADSTHLR